MQDYTEVKDGNNLKLLETELKDIENWATRELEERGVLYLDEVYTKLHRQLSE